MNGAVASANRDVVIVDTTRPQWRVVRWSHGRVVRVWVENGRDVGFDDALEWTWSLAYGV